MPAEHQTLCRCAKSFARHTAKLTQNWLKVNMENHWSQEIWPPSSPDCTPIDLSMWSEFEREVNKHPFNTLASLRVKILGGMGDKDREVVIRSYKKFWSRIEAVVVASGDFIK
jgi:hypothetical protein